jgi:sulfatase maturation enzyme AslB (radical SAM superfamily)
MKIYQLHKYGGEWEDYRNYIIGSYLHKERADEEMAKAQDEELQKQRLAQQCANCPYHTDDMGDNQILANLMREHCDHSDIYCDEDGDVFCKNFYLHWIDHEFNIEEVEVIE